MSNLTGTSDLTGTSELNGTSNLTGTSELNGTSNLTGTSELNGTKKNGISFMVRVRNEEKTLEESIRSLFGLTIPHEIIIILHLCTDKSEEIAEKLSKENSNIKIHKYTNEISRAGYELLATDSISIHSIAYYYNWCLALTNCHWVFKWDGDFISTPSLIDFLNNGIWEERNAKYYIKCNNTSHTNKEPYLMSGLIHYIKYQFWEVGLFKENNEGIYLDDNISITHASELTELKEYWKKIPWYQTETSEEALLVNERMKRLVEDFGIEAEGLARASNPECNDKLWEILEKNPEYVNFYM
jgi:glycosyltransferase involved in cell wall biosynthesis